MTESAPQLQVVPDTERPFRRNGLGYVFEPPGSRVRLQIDYIARRSDEVKGEILVETTLPGLPPHLHQAGFTLTSTSARTTLGKHLGDITNGTVQWRELLEQFCAGVLRAEREGEPFVKVGRLPARVQPPDLIDGFLPAGKPTLLYGPGGSGKGWWAVGCAVAVQTGTAFAQHVAQQGEVLYLDWEDDEWALNDRIAMVARGMGLAAPPEFHYRACQATLAQQVHQIARYVQEHDIRLVIVDSFEMAAGAVGDRSTYEEVAKVFFKALRHVGPVTALIVDHVSKDAKRNEKGTSDPYGSVFKLNWVRNAWEIRKDQEAGELVSHVGLYNTKVNHGPLRRPIGCLLDFREDSIVRVSREDVGDSATLVQRLPQHEQLARALRAGARTAKDLGEQTDMGEHTARSLLNRYKDRFIHLQDGRWALLERPAVEGRPASMALPSSTAVAFVETANDAQELPF